MNQIGENMLVYKGYRGTAEYDDNAETFYGTVINANVLISYRGTTVEDLKASFRDVVDTYLDDCRENGIEPEKTYTGRLTLRLTPRTHERVAMKAAMRHESLNQYVEEVLENDTEDLECM